MKMSITKYLLFTFLLSYGCWVSIHIANNYGYLTYGTPVCMILFLLGGWSPTIFGVLYKMKNSNLSFKTIMKDVFHFKQPPIFYAMIVLACLSFYITPYILNEMEYGLPIYTAIMALPLMVFGGGLEELGWRSLQLYLENKFSFFISSLITGCIWAAWHFPLFIINGSNQSKMNLLSFIIYVMGMAFLLGAITHITKSIWLCVLFHSLMNTVRESFLVNETVLINSISTILMISLSLLLVTYFKNKSYQVKSVFLLEY